MKIPYFLIILTVYLAAEFSEGQKYKCEKPKLKNGRVRIKSSGQIARFRCNKSFKRAGAKIALCIKDFWNLPAPICVAPGKKCPKQKFSKDLLFTKSMSRGFLEFSCKPGLILEGKDKIYCDGSQWSDEAPKCVYNISTEATTVPLVTTAVSTETEPSSYQSTPTTETSNTANPTTYNNRPTAGMSTTITETPSQRTGHLSDTTLSEFTDLYSKTQVPTHSFSVATKRKSKVSTSHPAKTDSTTVLKPNIVVKNSTTKSLVTTELRMTTEQYINITTTGSNTDTDTTETITHINTEPTRLTQTTEDQTTYTTPGPKQETETIEQPSTKAKTTEQSIPSTTVRSRKRTETTEQLTTLTTAEPSRETKTTEKLTTLTTTEPSTEAKSTEHNTTLTTVKPSEKTTVTEKPTATTNKGTIITTQSTTILTPTPKRTTTFPPSSTQKPQKPTTTSPPTTTEIKTTTAVSVKTSSIPSIQSTTVTRSTDSTTSEITSTTQSVSSEISHYSTYRVTTTPSNPTSSSTSRSKTTLSVNTTARPVQSTTKSMYFNNTIKEDIAPATKPSQNDTDIPNVIVASQQSVPDDTPIKPLVIGLGVGVAIGLVILIVGSYLWVRRRRRKEEECDEMTPITGTGSQEW
ncbi:mucin-5AC-like [Crassostrea angulata]|uniref:mucin-5AC-like n=1 Tax=Magallana angulata TaxID=2784310 RepID=UPI0022B17ED9|nr:mucin-5AC-like [Crassostrea angulata]